MISLGELVSFLCFLRSLWPIIRALEQNEAASKEWNAVTLRSRPPWVP